MNAKQRDVARLELYKKAMSEIDDCGATSENFDRPRHIRMGVTNMIAHNIRVHMDGVDLSTEEKRALEIVQIAKQGATSPQVLIDAATFYLSQGSSDHKNHAQCLVWQDS